MERKIALVNLDELANRWQIPVGRVKYFVTELGMNPMRPEKWVAQHWDIFMAEKRQANDAYLLATFPERIREAIISPTATSKTS